jgi:molybdate transport system ATP-binding protein
MDKMLTVNLKKHFYNKREVVFRLDISFTVGNGFTVLTGSSGAGKTSLLRMIAGILTPDSGIIKMGSQTFFDSANKVNLSIQERRIGFVFQDYALFPHLTAEQNIAYGVKADNQKLKLEKAREMLSLFHIEQMGKRIPAEMSGGEQQRVALARALASDPLIVLLDEPLSAVDVETRSKLLDEIENARSRTNIPFIYVTHNQAEAERLGKYRIRLENGQVINSLES